MTTIIYKDGEMAADGRVTEDSFLLYEDFEKIHYIEGVTDRYVIGIAGALSQVITFLDWAKEDFDADSAYAKPEGIDEIRAIVCKHGDPDVYGYENTGFINYGQRHIVIGSGTDIAQAGVLMGLGIAEAIDLASKVDLMTNNIITKVNVRELFNAYDSDGE